MSKKVIVIGAGFSGLAAATALADKGYDVTVVEKHPIAGGRARKLVEGGFSFDMGPSWYWMPDVFEDYFASFGKKPSEYYALERLDPSYKIYFGPGDEMALPSSLEAIYELYEKLEPGSSVNLKRFLKEGEYKYKIGIGEFVHKPGLSILEFFRWKIIKAALNLNLLTSFEKYTHAFFKSEKIRRMLEFPVLFLGGTAKTTPALYSLMNYSDMVQGTWYPAGGMYKVVEAMEILARERGVTFEFNTEVTGFHISGNTITAVLAGDKKFVCDYAVASADYHFIEQQLLPKAYRKYSKEYWESRVLSPSSLIFYMGFNTRIPELSHHTLLFDEDFNRHADSIYKHPDWPEKPSVYISCTSRTDDTVAPEGHENVMILIPVAPGLSDTPEVRNNYQEHVLERLERYTGKQLKNNLVYVKSYAHNDFEKDYNAFKGNAYGLANTLLQTAFLKPKLRNNKLGNLYYSGQLTVPGPGVPPAIISGQITARLIHENESKKG